MTKPETKIESDLETVGHILTTDFRYKVPLYQRNFSWTLEEVSQLWQDILQALEEDRSEYFLGTIVVDEDRDKKTRTIIDGQQRLATLSTIFSAVRTIYAEHDDERAEEVYKDYLGVRDRRTRLTEPRLMLNVVNEPEFQRFVVDKVSDDQLQETILSKRVSISNILMAQAALFIREAVRERSNTSPKYENFLLSLEEYVRDRVVMILVAVGDEADAYLIFETLNDRGLDLSIGDLLKNYIFGRARNRLDTVRHQWEEMALLLGGQSHAQFLRHFWLSNYGVVRDRDLYKEMKRKFASPNQVLGLMSDLRDAADKYAALANVDHPIWKGYGDALRSDLETLQLFGLSQFRPLALAALDTLPEGEVAKVIRIIVVVSMRYSIIGSLGPGNIEKAYSDAAIQIRGGKANSAGKVFLLLKSIYPDDARFEADFTVKEVSKAKLARYILSEIATHMQGTSLQQITENEKVCTLEHIMPKSRTADWVKAAKDEAEYYAHVNRLGNLTLIERTVNMVSGSSTFAKKVSEAYARSELRMNAELAEYPQWTTAEIQDRQTQLAKHAVAVWRLPY